MKDYEIEALDLDYYKSVLFFKDHQGKKRSLKLTDNQCGNLIFSQEIFEGLVLWIRIDEKYAALAHIPEIVKIDVGHKYEYLPALED